MSCLTFECKSAETSMGLGGKDLESPVYWEEKTILSSLGQLNGICRPRLYMQY